MHEFRSATGSKIAICRFFDIHCHDSESALSKQRLISSCLAGYCRGERLNQLHRWLCRSSRWKTTLEQRIPWVLSSAELGPHVLEAGPGPGLTTDHLRSEVLRLTAIEADHELAQSLRARLSGTNVEVVHGDATTMPFP